MKFIFYSFIILSVTLNFFTSNTTINKNFHQINLAAATLENNHPQNKTNGDVIVGESNWLFIARNDIKCFLGEDSLSAGHLIVIAKELKRRQELYAKKGIKLYFAIAPNKLFLYNQFLPKEYKRKTDKTWGEAATQYLMKNTDIKVVDLFSYFKKNSANNLLYYKLDNHWNQLAGFHAANGILEVMKKDFKKINLNDLEKDFKIEKKEITTGNLISMLGSKDKNYVDEEITITCKNTCNSFEVPETGYAQPTGFKYDFEQCKNSSLKGRPKILLITESFGTHMFPFISEQCGHSTKLFDKWEYKSNMEIVEKEAPDAVVIMILESNLKTLVTSK